MMKNKKLLIGILVIVILIAGGWWIWSSQTIEGPGGICGPKGMGSNYDVSHCDKSCNTDNDCKFTCGCGAMNKNEICHDEGIIYDCVDRYVKCEEKRCIALEEKLSKQEVTIATDKTEYERGETVKITVRNGLSISIWDFASCGDMPFWKLQRFDGRQWKELHFSLPYLEEGKEICDFIVCEKPELTELKPSSEIHYNWPLTTICEWPLQPIGAPETEPEIIEEGTYRVFIIYGFSKDFSFLDGQTIYSNEFTIK